MRQSRVTGCLFLAILALAAGACGDDAEEEASNYCTKIDCGIEIDCAVACDHRLAICAEGCSYANCTRSLSREGCMQECDQALAASSDDFLLQCLTAHDTCEEIRECGGY